FVAAFIFILFWGWLYNGLLLKAGVCAQVQSLLRPREETMGLFHWIIIGDAGLALSFFMIYAGGGIAAGVRLGIMIEILAVSARGISRSGEARLVVNKRREDAYRSPRLGFSYSGSPVLDEIWCEDAHNNTGVGILGDLSSPFVITSARGPMGCAYFCCDRACSRRRTFF